MIRCLTLVVILSLLAVHDAHAGGTPQGSEFTYQGVLKQASAPASGVFDLEFRLFDVPSGGTAMGTMTLADQTVSEGQLTVALDFGASAFDGQERWLEIQVDATTLIPRQRIASAPYALYALETGPINIANLPTGGAWSLANGLNLDAGTLHVDPSTNRVGIGTTSPASALHVVGNTTLTGDVAVAGVVSFSNVPTLPATTRTMSVHPAEFEMRAGSSSASRDYFQLYSTAPQNNTVDCFAPLSLPDGAVITNVTFLVRHNSFANAMNCSLLRDETAIGDGAETFTTIGSGASSINSTVQGVSISGLPHAIDNTGHSYVLRVTWVTGGSSSVMKLLRVEVTYTITAPLP